MWLKLSNRLIYFGTGGVIEVADNSDYTQKSTKLWLSVDSSIEVDETIEQIERMLEGE